MQLLKKRCNRWTTIACSIVLIMQVGLFSGCGPSDPEAGLDRVPNVPPSTRGSDAKPRVPASPK